MLDNNSNPETLEQKAIRGLHHGILSLRDEIGAALKYIDAGQIAYEVASMPSPVLQVKSNNT